MNQQNQGAPERLALDEKIGLQRIRVAETHLRTTAVVGTFFAADKLLQGWAKAGTGELECEFEIVYSDGRKISGAYRFRRKGRARPALMGYVRASARAVCEDASCHCALAGLPNRPLAFLERYETADFADPM